MKRSKIAVAVCLAIISPMGFAYEDGDDLAGEISLEDLLNLDVTVTATRRSASIQDIPFNITALGGNQLESRNVTNLQELSQWVPGFTVVEQGRRDRNTAVIIRGLNTSAMSSAGQDGTVASYFGDVPMTADLYMHDIERVEVLIGPQGTLYGAGTLGGAVRYIPKKPEFKESYTELNAGLESNQESDDFGYTAGVVANVLLIPDKLSFRTSLITEKTPGYTDFPHLVRTIGVSNPEPDFNNQNDIDDNLYSAEDQDKSDLLSGKFALRWKPTDEFDALFTYNFQREDVDGRPLIHARALTDASQIPVGRYDSALRVLEPIEKEYDFFSVEVSWSLGFAELTSVTGYSKYKEDGQRDQTDLLLDFEYGYEDFPTFTAFTRDPLEEKLTTQEVRLVSTSESKLSWIAGVYFSKFESDETSSEFTPGIPEFFDVVRPDNLEFISRDIKTLKEQALFGEIGYQFTDQWQVTLGARYFEYNDVSGGAQDLPLLNTLLGDSGPTEVNLNIETREAEDNGSLFKLNTSYKFQEDMMTYLTISNGYRVGGVNGVKPCTADDLANPGQALCALPNEEAFTEDLTLNTELGFRSKWLDKRLTLNAALYQVDWEDIQLAGRTDNGGLTITSNAGNAITKGFELSTQFVPNRNWQFTGTFALTKAEIKGDAPLLGAGDGDRLPASPEKQMTTELKFIGDDQKFSAAYNINYQGDVLTSVNEVDGGQKLPSFTRHALSASYHGSDWRVSLYINNLFNEYAVTSVRNNLDNIRDIFDDDDNRQFSLRSYGEYITEPRAIGINFKMKF